MPIEDASYIPRILICRKAQGLLKSLSKSDQVISNLYTTYDVYYPTIPVIQWNIQIISHTLYSKEICHIDLLYQQGDEYYLIPTAFPKCLFSFN